VCSLRSVAACPRYPSPTGRGTRRGAFGRPLGSPAPPGRAGGGTRPSPRLKRAPRRTRDRTRLRTPVPRPLRPSRSRGRERGRVGDGRTPLPAEQARPPSANRPRLPSRRPGRSERVPASRRQLARRAGAPSSAIARARAVRSRRSRRVSCQGHRVSSARRHRIGSPNPEHGGSSMSIVVRFPAGQTTTEQVRGSLPPH
jgi:hypothetical protein